jgi:protein CpxP
MTLNLIKLLPSAVLAATLTCVPMIPAFAQSVTLVAQAKPALDLNLTAPQKAQLKEIQNATRAEIQKLLTPEQQSQLEAARGKGLSFHKAVASLKLTPEQKASVSALKKQGRAKEDAVLTDEQRQKMRAVTTKPSS